jgi:hypothetical protein
MKPLTKLNLKLQTAFARLEIDEIIQEVHRIYGGGPKQKESQKREILRQLYVR